MSKRQEDFFNEATKEIRDSYVFQSEGTYSDDDVRDIAVSLAEHGYQYAVDKACEWLTYNLHLVRDWSGTPAQNYRELVGMLRKAMQ